MSGCDPSSCTIPIIRSTKLKFNPTKQLATECGFAEGDDFSTVLSFYHDLGLILHLKLERNDDIVILNPQWLIDVFKQVITVLTHKEKVVLRFCLHISLFKFFTNIR